VRVLAGAVDDLVEGAPRSVRLAGRDVVLVRWRGRVFAIRDVCPHMTQSFELGSVIGRPCGSVGEVDFHQDVPIITCPWHQFEFSLESGRCLTDRTLRVRRYDVSIEDGDVYVDVSRSTRPPSARAPRPG
jgi:3-phenylpropionate/trans-cinnamate dioxygenase ferredoxin subunit